MRPALAASATFGALCAPVGIAVGAVIGFNATGKGYEWFFLPAGLAAFLVALGSWWLVVERSGKLTRLRGAIAGAVAGIVAHHVCWYFVIVANFVRAAAAGESLGGNAGAMDPLNAIWGAAVFSFWSLLLFGWLTFPLGVALGVGYARWRQKKLTSA